MAVARDFKFNVRTFYEDTKIYKCKSRLKGRNASHVICLLNFGMGWGGYDLKF